MKKVIKRLLKRFGYEIILTKNNPKSNQFIDQKKLVGNEDGIVIFDVGAHQGHTSLNYNTLFNTCTIYSFEPFIDSYTILTETVKGYQNIKPFNTALGNIVGEVDFHVNQYSATNSILPTHQEGSNIWGANLLDTLKVIKVNSTTIDDFIERHAINQIDILKLDTQGTEYNIIEGAAKAIEQGKIKLIYLEIITLPTYQNQKHFDEVLRFLRLNGFNLYNMYDYSFTQLGFLRQVDAIFLSQFHHNASDSKG